MYFLLRHIICFFYRIAFNLKFEGLENIPREGVHIYACNHRSYNDPVLMALRVKKPFSYMAKSELFEKNAFAALIRFFGAFPVERGKGDMNVIDESVKRLKAGRNLAIFPEGTRSVDGKLGRGKSGVVLIAAKTGADVIPMAVVYGEKLKFRTKLIVRFGKPIPAEKLAISDEKSLREIRRLREMIMDGIAELLYKDDAVCNGETGEKADG